MKNQTKKQKKHKEKYTVSDAELLEVIEIISKKLSYKFKFGYHDTEDMRQQISIFAIEGLEKYDHTRPLENFLWIHVRNRLYNFKRDNYQRPDVPCKTCPLYDKVCANENLNCTKYLNKKDCDLYSSWYNRNNIKKNLMYFNTIEETKNIIVSKSKHDHELKDIIDILEEELAGEERHIYLKIKYGSKVYKQDHKKLSLKIKEILNNYVN